MGLGFGRLIGYVGDARQEIIRPGEAVVQLGRLLGQRLGLGEAPDPRQRCGVVEQGHRVVGIALGGAAAFAKFSRTDEVQADEGGFQNVMNAGIDPRGMLTFFQKLLDEEQGSDRVAVLSWFTDHPGTADRVDDVKRMIAAQPAGSLDRLRRNSDAFVAMKQALSELPPAPPPAQQPGMP